jgi:hypothetical protein
MKRSLVIGKIVEREHISVEPGDVEERISNLSTPWGDRAAEMRKLLSTNESREMLELDLLTDKGIDRLAAIARGEVDAQAPPVAQSPAEAAALANNTVQAEDAATSEGMPTPEASTATAEAAQAENATNTENNPPAAPETTPEAAK